MSWVAARNESAPPATQGPRTCATSAVHSPSGTVTEVSCNVAASETLEDGPRPLVRRRAIGARP